VKDPDRTCIGRQGRADLLNNHGEAGLLFAGLTHRPAGGVLDGHPLFHPFSVGHVLDGSDMASKFPIRIM
jgi:hypothetical protein